MRTKSGQIETGTPGLTYSVWRKDNTISVFLWENYPAGDLLHHYFSWGATPWRWFRSPEQRTRHMVAKAIMDAKNYKKPDKKWWEKIEDSNNGV